MPDKGPLCCLCLRGNLLGWDIFLSPFSPVPLLRNSCDQRRGRAWPRRSVCGAWSSGTFSKASFSLMRGGRGTSRGIFWGLCPP